MLKCNCGREIPECTAYLCLCGAVHGKAIKIDQAQTMEVSIVALPKLKTDSSLWLRLVKRLRKPEDRGVGDTVQRIAAKFGGERFKAFAARIGIPCGCSDRQAAWNEQWPYT